MQSSLPISNNDQLAAFLKSAKPADWRAFLELSLLGYLRLFLATGLFVCYPSPLTFALAFYVNTSAMGVMVNLSHEAQHGALLRSKKWNDWVGSWLCAYPVGSIYGMSRAVHLAHHKYLNTEVDPDRHFHWEEDKSTPGQFIWYFVRLVLGGQLWTSIVVNGFLRAKNQNTNTASSVVNVPQTKYPELANLVPVQLILFLSFWVLSGHWWLYFALWLLPLFTLGTALGFVRGMIDHARLASDDPTLSDMRLISVPKPSIVDRMLFTGLDFEYHAEHHLFPSVPHYFLPHLHKILQADPQYKDRYLLRESYTSFLGDYWKQICNGKKSPNTLKSVSEVVSRGSRKKLKVLFLQPRLPQSFWGMEYTAPLLGFRYPNPPLGIMTLAGVLTPEFDVEIRDENIRPVDFDTDADIVAISGTLLNHMHIERVIELSKYFRNLGKIICIGGPVANLSPDVVRPYCDVLFEGEGELTWPQFMKDYQSGEYKSTYTQVEKIDMSQAPLPRIDLVRSEDYGAGQIQTTRGCPFTCEFCDIIVVFGRKVRAKPIPTVLKEVEMWADSGQQLIFFSDDNFVGNRVYVKQLLRELIVLNSKRRHPVCFYTQASIDMAKDPELMELMRDANFAGVFIGIESPRKSVLEETHKVQNVHTFDMAEAIHTIQSYGLWVSGGMIVGFDNDDKDIFDEQFEFLQKSGVVFAQMSLLEAMPKTPLYERMQQNGRLLPYQQGLCTNINPLNMTYQELVEGYTKLIQRVYTYDAYSRRYLTSLYHMRANKFPLDHPQPRLKSLIGLIKVANYYLNTNDSARRKFFFRMIFETLRIQPRAWKWTMRYLANFIHFHTYATTNIWVTMAPIMANPPAVSKAS